VRVLEAADHSLHNGQGAVELRALEQSAAAPRAYVVKGA